MDSNETTDTTASQAAAVIETPTVGRRLHFWGDGAWGAIFDPKQPFDAGVLFVHPEKDDCGRPKVCVQVTDHAGNIRAFPHTSLRNPEAEDHHHMPNVATWMPYHMKAQAAPAPGPAAEQTGTSTATTSRKGSRTPAAAKPPAVQAEGGDAKTGTDGA